MRLKSVLLRPSFLALAFFALGGCADGTEVLDAGADDAGQVDAGAVDGGAAPEVVATGDGVTAAIDAAGGTIALQTAAGTWTLNVPATSLDASTDITLRPATSSALGDAPVILLEPTGLQFRNGALLTFSGKDSPSLALSFEPGAAGVDLTYASSGDDGVRFVLEHFSAAAVVDGVEGVASALTPQQRDDAQIFESADVRESEAIALGEEARRMVDPSLTGANESVQRTEAAVTTYLNWNARMQESRTGDVCDSIRCVLEGTCSNAQECGSQRCESGGCVRTLAVVGERLRQKAVAEIQALYDAITSPTCEDRSTLPRAVPEFWIVGPETASQQVQLIEGSVVERPLCATAKISLEGPATLGDDTRFSVVIRPFIETPTGSPEAQATLSLSSSGANPVGEPNRLYDGRTALTVEFDRGANPVATAEVTAAANFEGPWANLGQVVASKAFNRSDIVLVARAVQSEVRSAQGRAEICVTMTSDGEPVQTFNVFQTRVDGTGTVQDLSTGTGTGEEVCGVFYVAPSPLPEERTTVRVTVRARTNDGEVGEDTVAIDLVPGDLQLSVTATPDTLLFDNSFSEVCVTMVDGDAALERFEAHLELIDGSLGGIDSDLIVAGSTTGCVFYQSPGTLPETREVVRIRVTGTAAGQERIAEVEIVLDKNAPQLFSSLQNSVQVDGEAQLCGEVNFGETPAPEQTVVFRKLSGGGTLSAASAITDAFGRACVTFTAPSTAGTTVLEVEYEDALQILSDELEIVVVQPPPPSLFSEYRGVIDCTVFDASASINFQNYNCGGQNFTLDMDSGGLCNRDICFTTVLSSTNCGFSLGLNGAGIDFIDASRVDFSFLEEDNNAGFLSRVDETEGSATLTPGVLDLDVTRSRFNSLGDLTFRSQCVFQGDRL